MQPCGTCGGMGIDAGGYCTTCRTYRGLPSAPAPQGYSVIPPASGAPYPGSGVPYSNPTSGSPYGAPAGNPGYTPTSGAPYPNYGGGFPASPGQGYPPAGGYPSFAAPPTPPRSRSSFVVPLIALSVTLVVLVVAIVAVAALRGGRTTTASPLAPATGKSSSIVDSCVVGLWNATSESQDVAVDGVGSVKVAGSGMKVRLRADGTGAYEYNDTRYAATIKDQAVEIIVKGIIKYDYRTSNGSMSFSNFSNSGTAVVKVGGVEATSEPLTEDADPVRYSCSGTSLTQTTNQRNVTLTRVSSTP